MGVPKLFAWLTKKYPQIIFDKNLDNIDNFFFDFNGLIHPCAHKILSKYNNSVDKNQLERLIIKHIINYTDFIIDNLNINKLIYISIDGVAPLAKMIQQRKRRYSSVLFKQMENDIRDQYNEPIIDWDTNAISPGTIFMDNLTNSLKAHFSKKTYINNSGDEIKVILSSSYVVGEGEHKIINYIKQNSNNSESNVIMGLDADLIMLSLSTGLNNIYLYRENINVRRPDLTQPFIYLSIDTLRNKFKLELENRIHHFNINNVINDFIILTMLIGNDFLPQIPGLNVDNLDYLLDIYANHLNSNKNPKYKYLLINNKLNFEGFSKILFKLSKMEEDLLKKYIPRYDIKLQYTSEDPCKNDIKKMYYIKNNVSDKIFFYKRHSKQRYYNHYFNIDYNKNKLEYFRDVNNLCKNYFTMLVWNINYYFSKTENWQLAYKFNYAPYISDLSNYLYNNLNIVKSIKLYPAKPLEPLSQLMIILPPQSSHLLPNKYANLMTNINSKIIDQFPSQIYIDMMNKTWLHECIPLLPPLDNKSITKTIYENKLTSPTNKTENIITF